MISKPYIYAELHFEHATTTIGAPWLLHMAYKLPRKLELVVAIRSFSIRDMTRNGT